jgi:hypothetical protein
MKALTAGVATPKPDLAIVIGVHQYSGDRRQYMVRASRATGSDFSSS